MRTTICLIAMTLLTGCSGNGPPVEIVVPDGYRGPIWIVLDPGGQDIPLVNGRFEVVIPPDGVLRVQSFRPFERWHQSSARYSGGTALPLDHEPNQAKDSEVALRGGGSVGTTVDGKKVRWLDYFVGTAEQHFGREMTELPPAVAK